MRSIRLLAIFLAFAAFVASESQAQSIGAGIGIVKLEQDDETRAS